MTRDRLAIKVLSKVKAYDRTSPDAEDQENALDAYSFVYNELLDENLVTWRSDADIPDRFAGAIIDIVAARLVDDYPVQSDVASRLLQMAIISERRLRRQLSGRPTINTVKVLDY